MDAHAVMAGPAETGIDGSSVAALMTHRRTVLPKRLAEPGPDAAQLEQILKAAASAPDHGELLPWRFVVIPRAARHRLADVFAAALLARDAAARPEQAERAREKAFRAPLLMLAIVRTGAPDADVPPRERLVSAGCAIQNMLLMATALGFGSALTSGKALGSAALTHLFALEPGEEAVCFISIGTASAGKPRRLLPEPGRYVSWLPA